MKEPRNIREFAESRKITTGAVKQFIYRHKKEFEGHIINTISQKDVLDEEALRILSEKYPILPEGELFDTSNYVERATYDNLQTLYNKAMYELNEANKRLQEQAFVIAENEANKLLLEDKQSIIDKMASAQEEQQRKLDQANEDKKQLEIDKALSQEKIKSLEQEVDSFEKSIFGLYKKKKRK